MMHLTHHNTKLHGISSIFMACAPLYTRSPPLTLILRFWGLQLRVTEWVSSVAPRAMQLTPRSVGRFQSAYISRHFFFLAVLDSGVSLRMNVDSCNYLWLRIEYVC